jgi:hypothetical protein
MFLITLQESLVQRILALMLAKELSSDLLVAVRLLLVVEGGT